MRLDNTNDLMVHLWHHTELAAARERGQMVRGLAQQESGSPAGAGPFPMSPLRVVVALRLGQLTKHFEQRFELRILVGPFNDLTLSIVEI